MGVSHPLVSRSRRGCVLGDGSGSASSPSPVAERRTHSSGGGSPTFSAFAARHRFGPVSETLQQRRARNEEKVLAGMIHGRATLVFLPVPRPLLRARSSSASCSSCVRQLISSAPRHGLCTSPRRLRLSTFTASRAKMDGRRSRAVSKSIAHAAVACVDRHRPLAYRRRCIVLSTSAKGDMRHGHSTASSTSLAEHLCLVGAKSPFVLAFGHAPSSWGLHSAPQARSRWK
jgi:hypothetical protein